MTSTLKNTRKRVGVLLAAALLFGALTLLLTLGVGAHPTHCPAIGCDMLWNYENGFCLHCGAYEEPAINPGATDAADDDYYEIANAGNLYWLAAYINRTTTPLTVNAKLLCNITVNEGVLDADGALTAGEKREWTPIGINATCTGLVLDGDGYLISGLYAASEERTPVGFIATAAGVTVQNLGICDSYFAGAGTVGGIIAVVEDYCTVENCFLQGTLSAPVCGGIVGELGFATEASTVSRCYTTAGAVVGTIDGQNVLEDCYYLALGETDELEGTTYLTAEQFQNGTLRDALDTDELHWYHSCVNGLPGLRYQHVYNNPCDVECQKKDDCVNKQDGLREGEPHVFDNDCDTTCNNCGRIRTVGDHQYSNTCDTTCNSCGAVREALGKHQYSTPCDATCNNCSHTRTVPDHVYDGDCDPDCNNCGTRRENVAAHVFDNSCDTTCNSCGVFRAGGHQYSFVCDEFCDVCNGKRTVKHPYGEFVTTREPTEFEEGEKVKTCTVCGATVTESIPPIIKIPLGALIAIVIGGSAVLVFGGYAIIYFIRKKKK